MIYISKELYLYISYVIKKNKNDKNKNSTRKNSMYKMYKREGDVKYYRREWGNNIWLKYQSSYWAPRVDKNDGDKVT